MKYKIERLLIWKAIQRGDVIVDYRGYCHFLHQNCQEMQTLHRRVAEQLMGRKLSADEHVHHVDVNPQNNHPSNLLVMAAVAHRRLHSAMAKIDNLDQREWLAQEDAVFIDLAGYEVQPELLSIISMFPKPLDVSLEEDRLARSAVMAEKQRLRKIETQRKNRLAGAKRAENS